MGEENDGLGLGLSLGLGLGLGHGPNQPPSPPFLLNLMQTPSDTNNTLFGFSADRNAATSFRSFVREIDVNHAAAVEDENGESSPNSTVSSQSGKRSEAERTSSSRGGSDDEDGGEGSKKKLRLTKEQSLLLEDKFKEHHTLNTVSSITSRQKQELAQQLNLSARQVEVWFQNRRASSSHHAIVLVAGSHIIGDHN